MHLSHVSASLVSKLDFCEQAYFLKYVLGLNEPVGAAAHIGSVVHKVLECLALWKKHQKAFEDSELGIINSCDIDNLLNLSFNFISNKYPNLLSDTDKKTCIKLINKTLLFKNGMYNPLHLNVVDAEQYFDLELNTSWCKNLHMTGVIDLVTLHGDNVIEIIDWKTGARFDWSSKTEKGFSELCNDIQLQLYFYAAKKLYPHIQNIIITIFYIKDGGPTSIPFTDITLEKLDSKLETLFRLVTECRVPRLVSPTRDHFKCKKLCFFGKTQWQDSGQSICEFMHRSIIKDGIDITTEKYQQRKVGKFQI